MQRTPTKATSSAAAPSSTKRVFQLTSPDLQNEKRQAKRIMAGDNNTVGNMSQRDLVKILGDLLEQKTEHLATKADVVNLREEVLALKNECDALKKEVNSLNATNAVLQKKVEACEERQKRFNVIFKGLPQKSSSNPCVEVQEFCKSRLGIEKQLTIRNAYRIGKEGGKYPRPILAEYLLQEDINIIMENKQKLKGTNFVIHRDRSECFRRKRMFLLELKSELLKINKNCDCQVKGHQLIVNQQSFACNEDFSLITRDGDAVLQLSKLMGTDVKEMVRALATKQGNRRKGATDIQTIGNEQR